MSYSASPLQDRIAAIAARQHGIIELSQLEQLGMRNSTIQSWTEAGRLRRLHRGIYTPLPPSMLTVEGHWLAAVRGCGGQAYLSGPAAGQLQWLIERRERFAIHVSVRGRSDRKLRDVLIHRPRSLPPSDTTIYNRIPVTTPTRTVWDLASVLSPLALRRAFEKTERTGNLDRSRLEGLLLTSPTHKGAGRIRALLSSRRLPLAETRSILEDVLFEICSHHSLPLPEVNAPLLDYEVDFLWRSARLVVEADGGDHLTPSQRDADNERDTALGRAGYLVRRYSSTALEDRAAVAAQLLAILRERSPLR